LDAHKKPAKKFLKLCYYIFKIKNKFIRKLIYKSKRKENYPNDIKY